MDEFVGGQGHAALGDFVGALLKFIGGALGREQTESREVEVAFTIFYVVSEPPTDRLHFSIPRIFCAIRVAIVAGCFEQETDLRRRVSADNQIVGGRTRRAKVFRLAYELYCRENHKDPKENSLPHDV